MKYQINTTLLSIFWIFLSFTPFLHQNAISTETGTLIITYKTTEEKERLDRIRFWLINEHNERTLYPKKNEYVTSSHSGNEKTVVITHLPVGNYQLEFLLPNTDYFFEEVPKRKIEITAGSVIKVDQNIHIKSPNPSSVESQQPDQPQEPQTPEPAPKPESQQAEHIQEEIPSPSDQPLSSPVSSSEVEQPQELSVKNTEPESNTEETALVIIRHETAPHHPIRAPLPPPPPPPSIVRAPPGIFSLTSNKEVHWELIHNGQAVYSHNGSVSKVEIPSGRNFTLLSEEIPEFDFYTIPPMPFDIKPNEEIHIKLVYQKNSGFVRIEGDIPLQLTELPIKIQAKETNSIAVQEKLTAANGKLFWKSPPLPIGSYTLSYQLQAHYIPVENQDFSIEKNQVTVVHPPSFSRKGTINIQTDSQEAKFTLINEGGAIIGEGKGTHYTFEDLEPGNYTLEYSSIDPSLKPPAIQNISVNYNQISEVKVNFHRVGGLVLKTQEPMHIILTTARDKKEILNEIITEKINTLMLPEGHYLLTYHPAVNFDNKNTKSLYVTVHTILPRTIDLYTSPGIPILEPTEQLSPAAPTNANKPAVQQFVQVPAGKAIIGDPFTDNRQNERPAKEIFIPTFSLATYVVTNVEFAEWLTQAFLNKKATLDPTKPGFIFNMEGQLLCKTMEGHPMSQITIKKQEGIVRIQSIPGKENFPVINVTWYGANSYSLDKNGRLPSESEWEKAAGMSLPSTDSSAKRFKYGFGRDEIDRTWANYHDQTRSKETAQVLTNPVGFYNGENMLPLTIQDRTPLKTHDAKSPAGAYDMSGNVWEWVGDWEEKISPNTFKIVKGGCYDSSAEGVRVSERLALSPSYCDIYTGFRMAKSID